MLFSFFSFLFLIFLYLAALGLSCGMWDPPLWHMQVLGGTWIQLLHRLWSCSLTGD